MQLESAVRYLSQLRLELMINFLYSEASLCVNTGMQDDNGLDTLIQRCERISFQMHLYQSI